MRLLILIFSLWALAYAKPEMYKEKEDFQFSRSSSDDGTKSGFYGAQRGNMGGNYEKAHNMDSLAQHQMSTLVRQVDGELGEGANMRTGSVYTAGNSRGIYGSGNFDLSNLKGRNFEESTSYGDSQSSFSSQNSGYSGNSYAAADNARYSGSSYSAADNARYSGSSYSAADNSRYTASQRALGLNSAYLQTGLASQYGQQIDNQQAENQYSGTSNYEYGSQGGSNYGYYTHGGSQARSEYDQTNTNLHTSKNYEDTSKSKLITTPVRFYIRPGTRITIPVSAQTYDASQNALVRDQNTVNTEAEILSNSGQRINVIKPVSNAKHYEHSYSYRKEWEKHDSQPVAVMPTENPFPKNSELYEDSQLSQVDGQQQLSETDSANIQSSNINSAYSSQVNSGYSSGHIANAKSATASRLQYQSQQRSGANAASNAYDTHNAGATGNLNSLVENINSKPKSYQSSYSYHKSWERRGDPYVILPAGGDASGQISQRLLAATTDQNLYYGNQYGQTSCDLQCHLRKKRSYNMEQYQPHMYGEQFSQHPSKWENLEYLGQQTQNKWDDLESLGQQTQNQWSNLEDLGQQTQNKWDNFESFNQHPHSYIEELGQQSQTQLNNLEDLGQQTQNTWDNLESLNHHTQSGIEEIGQQSQSQLNNLEDLGQQTQNTWDNLDSLNQHTQSGIEEIGQQSQSQLNNLEDLGQQTQNTWNNLESLNQHTQSGIEEIGQQSQGQLNNLEDLGQQTQNTWDNLESLNQHTQSGIEEIGQQSQSQLNNLEDLGQQTQNTWNNLENLNQHTQSGIEEIGQQSQSQMNNLEDLGQQTQNTWNNLESLNQHTQSGIEEIDQQSQSQMNNLEDLGQQTQNTWNNLESLNQHTQSGIEEIGQESQSQLTNLEDLGQQTQNTWNNLESLNQHTQSGIEEIDQQSQTQLNNLENLGQQTQSQWGKLEGLGQEAQNKWEKFDYAGQQTQTKWNKENTDSKTQNNEQQTFNTWNELGDQQSRKPEEQTHRNKVEILDTQNKNSEDSMDQTMFHYTRPGHSVWDNINNFESQQNTQSYNEHSSTQHISFNHNNFMHKEQIHNHWKDFSGAFNQENVDPWSNIFQDHHLKQSTDDETHMTSNTEKSIWDAIDKMISESDKKTDNVNNEQYMGSNTYNKKWEVNQNANNNYQNSFNVYQKHDFGESKETLTEKSIGQTTESNKNLEIESIYHSVTTPTTEKIRTTEKPKNTITTHQINSPHDIGRGDIGPEEIPPMSLETKDQRNDKEGKEGQEYSNTLSKTQDEIESFILAHTNEDKIHQEPVNDEQLHVLSLDQQVERTSTSTIKPKLNYHNTHTDILTHYNHPKHYYTPSYNNPSTFEIKPSYTNSQNTEVQIPENIEQQNFEQTSVDLEPQISNTQDLTEFDQEVQVPFDENMQQEFYSQQHLNNFNKDSDGDHEDIQTQFVPDSQNTESLNVNEKIQHVDNNFETAPKIKDAVVEPIEPTEKPGFWGSVWKKTVNAKDKVVSWFKN